MASNTTNSNTTNTTNTTRGEEKAMTIQKRSNETTLSIYVQRITVDCYDKATRAIEEKTFYLYAEKAPSVTSLENDLKAMGFTPVGDMTITLDTEKSGLYTMSHEDFLKHATRVGDTRPKKERADK